MDSKKSENPISQACHSELARSGARLQLFGKWMIWVEIF